MKLKDILELAPNHRVKLIRADNGHVVCSSYNHLPKYNDVGVLRIQPKIETSKDKSFCYPILQVAGSIEDIDYLQSKYRKDKKDSEE